ncbi:MAG TPA: ABC transporter ATP-binding protein [Opitutaceae bacterium]|nr:ABC transporter ATP-binding protein [Opitutaceae bacterium]HRJ46555.1 ABC transporter ATP-binding protein [Opitutaceae bacterium]
MTLRRFRPYLAYLRPVRGPLIVAITAGLLYGAATGAGLPSMINYVFPAIFDGGERNLPLSTVALIAAYIPLIFVVRGIFAYLNGYYIQVAGTRILEALRVDYFAKLQVLPLSFVQQRQTGDLLSRGLADTAQLQQSLTLLANDGMKQPGTLLFALGWLALASVRAEGVGMLLLCLGIVPLTVFPIRYVGRKVLRRAEQLQAQLGSLTGQFSENLAAAREVRAFGLETRETGRFAGNSRTLLTLQLKIAKYAQALSPTIEVVSSLGIAGTFLYAYHAGIDRDAFLAVVTALYLCYEPIKKIGALNNELKRGEASLARLEQVLQAPVTIADPAAPVSVARLRGDLGFEDVSFAYGDQPALSGVTARIPAGTVCALVGPSGAGKTTFANLVPRFYEAAAGSVRLDDTDVRTMRLADLRRNIALVSQEPVLFNDTIYNNLLLGRPEAGRDEVMAAAVDAHADEFIRTLPQGYDTVVGERGALLSGGQKQRVALARAFLRNAPILILDEATSALDSDSEAAVQDALRKLVVGKTVLVIAHRFSTIRDATLILVFDRGRIVAQGNHAELYAGNPLYRSLYDRQNSAA